MIIVDDDGVMHKVVLISVLEDFKADIDKLDFDFGDFYDHTASIHEMIDEVWNKYMESEG